MGSGFKMLAFGLWVFDILGFRDEEDYGEVCLRYSIPQLRKESRSIVRFRV